jgi:hypothetical protein
MLKDQPIVLDVACWLIHRSNLTSPEVRHFGLTLLWDYVGNPKHDFLLLKPILTELATNVMI